MTDTDALRKRLNEIRWQLRGEARLAALEEHLAAVEADGDAPLLNATLTALVDCYEYSTDSTRLLVPYARLLRNLDTAPEHFDDQLLRSVYWQFKWIVYKLRDHPDVPLDSIEDALTQFRERYSEAGHSLHPYYEAEHWFAHYIGDRERADRAAAQVRATEPDSMSDCEACRVNDIGDMAACAGDDEAAVAAWRPLLDGRLRCAHEPHNTLADSLLPLARLGRLDEARANHHHGYRISRDKDDMLGYIARHLRFCALTGNEARAIEILAADRRAYELPLSPDTRQEWLEGVQTLAAALRARGMGDALLAGPGERDWTADDLHEWADTERRELCERYDRRNGTTVHSERSRELVEPDRRYPHVPLGLKAMPLIETAPEPVEAEPGDRSLEDALAHAREGIEDAADDRAERWLEVGRIAEALGAELDPADEAEMLLAKAEPKTALEAAQDLAAIAATLFAEAGLPGRALLCRIAKAAWGMRAEPAAFGPLAPGFLAEADALTAAAPADAARARAQVLMAQLQSGLMLGERPGDDLAAAFAEADAGLAVIPGHRRAALARTQLAMMLPEFETEAEGRITALGKAFGLATDGGFRYETFISAFQYGSMLNQAGRLGEALAVAETGIAAVKHDYPPFPVAALHLTAAECSINLGDARAAERHAVQAAHWYDRAGETGCAGVARHLLGKSLAMQQRGEEAVVILEAALADLAEMHEDEHWRLVDSRYLLAENYQRTFDAQVGLTHVLEGLRLMDEGLPHPNPAFYAQSAHLAGELLERTGEAKSAVDAYGRSAAAWRGLGSLSAAANPIRAALWARLRTDGADTEAAVAEMGALATELEASWRNPDHPEDYRDACRREYAKTLAQESRMRGDDEESEEAWARRALTSGEAVLAVAEDGEFLVEIGVQTAHNMIAAYEELGDLDAAGTLVDRITARLDPEAHDGPRRALAGHLEDARERAADDATEAEAGEDDATEGGSAEGEAAADASAEGQATERD
ncbi:hypothetical protein SAMN05216298_3892 [Glycomyces sambucus]|uniref:Tetratricopeptide repeat-containing protein n=1 Tax=Glycomyces sambucus TaxID=380244 RepID=A0A1G9K870_9ACTN|nr:hypothetical protein [Glycomyces sambucus]SDL45624.1 hypothetical protein SAMN05216298_3892 [Glycomyces sambucus]